LCEEEGYYGKLNKRSWRRRRLSFFSLQKIVELQMMSIQIVRLQATEPNGDCWHATSTTGA
jgi:hypothetical protein